MINLLGMPGGTLVFCEYVFGKIPLRLINQTAPLKKGSKRLD